MATCGRASHRAPDAPAHPAGAERLPLVEAQTRPAASVIATPRPLSTASIRSASKSGGSAWRDRWDDRGRRAERSRGPSGSDVGSVLAAEVPDRRALGPIATRAWRRDTDSSLINPLRPDPPDQVVARLQRNSRRPRSTVSGTRGSRSPWARRARDGRPRGRSTEPRTVRIMRGRLASSPSADRSSTTRRPDRFGDVDVGPEAGRMAALETAFGRHSSSRSSSAKAFGDIARGCPPRRPRGCPNRRRTRRI